jgi:hypothetical protein
MAKRSTTPPRNGLIIGRALSGPASGTIRVLAWSHARGAAVLARRAQVGWRDSEQSPPMLTNVDSVESLTGRRRRPLSERSKLLMDIHLRRYRRIRRPAYPLVNVSADARRCGFKNSTNVIHLPLNCCSGGRLRNAGADSRRAVLSCSALVARLFQSGHTAPGRCCTPVVRLVLEGPQQVCWRYSCGRVRVPVRGA